MNFSNDHSDALALQSQQVLDTHAKSFSWAARFLSPDARRNSALLYAFSRAADDFSDEESLGPHDQRMQMLASLRRAMLEAADPASSSASNPIASAVGAMLLNHQVDFCVPVYFLDSLCEDSQPRQLQSTAELLQFAYGVAGTVGQMLRPVLGAPAQAEPYAMALGVAMQLTNIARDVVEDAERGRCYLPAQWSVDWKTMARPETDAQRAHAFSMLEKLLALAEDFYVYAETGLHFIPSANRRAIRVALFLYRGIGRKVLRGGPSQYWNGRVHLGNLEKWYLMSAALLHTKKKEDHSMRDVVACDLSHLQGVPGFPA
jgi:15-cis-phytoene synthase